MAESVIGWLAFAVYMLVHAFATRWVLSLYESGPVPPSMGSQGRAPAVLSTPERPAPCL